jgi:hypothetical protein
MDATLKTNLLGELAVAKVVIRAIEKGFEVSRPLIECRYDLVLDDGERLYRVQVKYAGGEPWAGRSGVIGVGLRKWRNGGRSVIHHYRASEMDLLLVYIRKLDCILCFGPDVFDGRRELQIRFEPAKNNQKKGCLMAVNHIW